ncbi:lytic polysaccharide monooxygenase [Laetiporus sulphureus 93-53]|uniref:lytic cellulose monooxygenase (C4-dehydrogenating) n=1 Tax=Laetiporus sulphureus 93-53 TaxID=1314785 RepID=A0A165D2Q9_9APHY|nr:lytic polysaccharide monooxygenase [Laetiporus sulphureus 93-53]KZT04041.1 lytic polysaccharide monooxygenase [Laetiporus sulphureus 93-53]
MPTSALALLLLLTASQVPRAAAHGYVTNITIGGATYQGNAPGHSGIVSPIRTVSSDSPVQNLSDPNLACGPGALAAPVDAEAAPGSAVNLTWVSGSGGPWPHEVGPILTYMTHCENTTTCAEFNTSGARWFKIDEVGKKSNGTGWVQEEIMLGAKFNVTIPDGLAPGPYLFRNEMIGLQNAMAPGGAEFFPSCTQLQITGNGTGVPALNDTVAFPGAYSPTDPGILFDAYDNPNAAYIFPGPPIVTLTNVTAPENTTVTTPNATTSAASISLEAYKQIPVAIADPDTSDEFYLVMHMVDADTSNADNAQSKGRFHSRIARRSH